MKKSLVRFLQVMYIFIFLLGSANIQVAFAQDLVPPATDTPAEALLTEVPPTEVPPTEVPPTEVPGGEVVPTEPPTIEATLPPEPEAPDLTETVVELADAGLTVVDETNEPVVLASESAVEALTVADPYFTRGGLVYRYLPLGGNCAPYALIDPPGSVCTVSATNTPIQDAINDVKLNGLPELNTIYVEKGEYNEALIFEVDNDLDGLTLMGAPGDLTIPGADPTNAPILDGTGVVSTTGITIRNEGISIKGFILRDWVTAILVDAGSGNIAINVENNTITNNVVGISQTGGTGKPSLNVHYNAFTSNTTALQNDTGNNFQFIEAQNNYWGCPTGPVVLHNGHYYQVDMVAPGVGSGQDMGTTAPTGCQFLNGNPADWNRQINTSDWSPFKINIGTILITFEKPTLTITASSHSMVYGGTVPTITPSYSGLIDGDTAPATPPTCSTTVTSTTDVGSYPGANTCSGAVDPKYNIVYVAGNMSVTPAPLLITASSHTMTYGGTVPTITPSYTGLVAGDTAPATPPSCSTTATSTSDVGTYPSTCSGAVDTNYTISYAPGVVTIEPAALVITASSHTMTYGGTVPTITPSYTGLVAGDTAPATPPTCSTTATSSSDVGNYPSTCTGAIDTNYTITYVAGNVEVTPAPLTITASSHTINYLDPVPTITPSYTGFVNGDTAPSTLPSCSTTATNTSPVGGYPSTCSGAADSNYTISYVPGTVTIGANQLVITASSHTITYGDPVPTITASYSTGSKPATMTTDPTCGTTAINYSDVGGYPTSCSGAVDPNYEITYVPGTLTINPAPLMITASSDSMNYGGTVPTITPSYSGLVAGDTAPATPPTCSTTATSTSDVGSYPSTCSGAVDSNYTISYTPGSVLVNPVPLMITASSDTMNYGGTVPTILPSYTGLVAGDTAPATLPSCSTTATSTSDVGPYPSTCSGAADANYTISYTPGTVTVQPVPLTITASTHNMPYGGPVPTITPSYSGLVAGDTAPATLPTCSTTVTTSTPAGFYDDANTCTGAADGNYTISYVPGDMTVEPIRLVITASTHTFTYGGTVPTITASYSTGSKPATMTTDPVCVTTATSSTNVGFYAGANTCSGAVDPNYDISYVAGDMTIEPAILMITASSHTMTYGGTVPTISPSYSGLVGGDTAPETLPVCSTTATSLSPVGPYPSTCVGAADGNYNIFYTSGVVTILPAPLTITASSGTMVAGAAVPAITPSYAGFVNGETGPAVPPVCSTTATSGSPVGTYPTSCTGAVAPNYSITYVPGTMTVTAPVIPPPPLVVPVTGAGGALIPVTGGNIIVSGIGHTCMTTLGGQVLCWGLNASGQVGNATFVNQLVPVYVQGLSGVMNLAAGSKHTCALTTDGSLWCWGDNSFGQLGNGTTTNSSVPVQVIDLPDQVLSFTAGEDFTCAQLRNNEVWCWGKNDLGQLNDGTTENQDSPVLSKLTEILSQLSGGRSLLLTSDLLGNLANWSKFEETAVNNVSDALSISANRWGNTGCAVQADGVIKCWGADLTAAEVEDSLLALEVGTGLAFNCVINQDETVSCWGENADGQLGNGTFDDSTAAVLVKYLGMVHDIGVGANHTCVLAGFGNYAQCWGDNTYGQLGNNTTIKSNLPVMVELPSQ